MPNAANALAQAAFALLDANGVPRKPGVGANNVLVLDNNGKIATANILVDVANGVAGLDGNGDLVRQMNILTDTAANLAGVVLAKGRPAYAYDTGKFTIGDNTGTQTFTTANSIGAVLQVQTGTTAYYVDKTNPYIRGLNGIDLTTTYVGVGQGALGDQSIAVAAGSAWGKLSYAEGAAFTGSALWNDTFTVSGNNLLIAGNVAGAFNRYFANAVILCLSLTGPGTLPKNARLVQGASNATFDGTNTIVPITNIAALGGATGGVAWDEGLGSAAHAEGSNNFAIGAGAHSEGLLNVAAGQASHAEGRQNNSYGQFSHTQGKSNTAWAVSSHASGQGCQAAGSFGHALGVNSTAGIQSLAAGVTCTAGATASLAAGQSCITGIPSRNGTITGSASPWTFTFSVNGDFTKDYAAGDTLIAYGFSGGVQNVLFQTTFTIATIDYNVTTASKTVFTTTNSPGDRTACSVVNTSVGQSAIALGFGAQARKQGQIAEASDQWNTPGDIQVTRTKLMGNTTTATALELTLDGFAPDGNANDGKSNRYVLSSGNGFGTARSYACRFRVLGHQTSGINVGYFSGEALVTNANGTITLQGNPLSLTAVGAVPSGWQAIVTVAAPYLQVKVVGAAGQNVLWNALVEALEVCY